MKIYGVALLAFCFLFGKLLGNYLGVLIGLKSDVGGVGFAMLLLMISYTYFKKKGIVKELTTQGNIILELNVLTDYSCHGCNSKCECSSISRTHRCCHWYNCYPVWVFPSSSDFKNRTIQKSEVDGASV
jgi:hypothetical protein